MDSITDLFKHVTTSNKLMIATLFTSLAITVGPSYLSYIKPVPLEWQWVPIACGIFSLIMLMLSLLSAIWAKEKKIPKALSSNLLNIGLRDMELSLLRNLGEKFGEDAMNLEDLDYSKVDRLDVLAARDALAERGLIRVGEWNGGLIWITKSGRELLLRIKR